MNDRPIRPLAYAALMKACERSADHRLTPGLPVVLRVDGNSFHGFTDAIQATRPFDRPLLDCMVAAAKHLFSYFSGAQLAFVESDEISLVMAPTATPFLGNRVQKLASLAASRATWAFYRALGDRQQTAPPFEFDARAFVVSPDDLPGYFMWRQEDAFKNAVNSLVFWGLVEQAGGDSVAARQTAHAALKGLNGRERQALYYELTGQPVTAIDACWLRGVCVRSGRDGVVLDEAPPRFTRAPAYLEEVLAR